MDAEGPPGVSPAASAINLTARKRQVLRLLVEGRSDREIADALFISRRTVHGLVAGIFAAPGVHTRTAAATAAIAAGLVPPSAHRTETSTSPAAPPRPGGASAPFTGAPRRGSDPRTA